MFSWLSDKTSQSAEVIAYVGISVRCSSTAQSRSCTSNTADIYDASRRAMSRSPTRGHQKLRNVGRCGGSIFRRRLSGNAHQPVATKIDSTRGETRHLTLNGRTRATVPVRPRARLSAVIGAGTSDGFMKISREVGMVWALRMVFIPVQRPSIVIV